MPNFQLLKNHPSSSPFQEKKFSYKSFIVQQYFYKILHLNIGDLNRPKYCTSFWIVTHTT